jgi:hypothetical protein
MPGSSTSEKTIDVFIGSAAGGGCDQRVSDSHSTAQHSESGSIRLAHRSGPHSLARLRGDAEQSTAVRHVPANAQLMGRDVLLRAAIHAAPCTESVSRMGVGNVDNRTAQTSRWHACAHASGVCVGVAAAYSWGYHYDGICRDQQETRVVVRVVFDPLGQNLEPIYLCSAVREHNNVTTVTTEATAHGRGGPQRRPS